MATLNPYLNFNNQCREAMNFYRDCLGGDLVLQTVGELPEMAAQMPPQMKDQILHSTLTSGNIVIMGSDCSPAKPSDGNTVNLCIHCDSKEQQDKLFSGLSDGGKITEALSDMPWGGRIGSLTDRYGKNWIFHYQ